ncbi:MAG: PKD domain-containing protein, partial [Bacteroidota bacterium]
SSDKNNGCFPLNVQFTDQSTPGAGNSNVSWSWDFGNGTTSTLQNPMATYSTAGLFNVTLRVTNDKGCTKTLSLPNYITVTPGVNAAFTNTTPPVSNPPVSVSFTNTSTGPGVLSYLWNFGDGTTSTLANPTHIYTTSGSYTTTLTVNSSSGCGNSVQNSPISIGGGSTSFSAPSLVCVNKTASFTNTSSPSPSSSIWTFGDGASSSGINASHSYTTPGIYTVWLHNNFSGFQDSTSQVIFVLAAQVSDFTAPVTGKCFPPLTVNFQDLTPGAQSWLWIFGDGTTSTLQNPVHTYTSSGSFTDTLITTNSLGCTDTIIKPNFIRIQKPSVSIPSLPDQGCLPFTISPVPTIVTGEPITSYKWDFGDGTTSVLPTPTHTYVSTGTYTVSLIISSASGCSDTLIIPSAIRVGNKPIANFTANSISVCAHEQVQFTDASTSADAWDWYFGDGSNSSNLQNPTHAFTDTGYFTITLVALNNGCADSLIKTNYIYVKPPLADFTSVANCSNRLEFNFTDNSKAPLTWQWNFGDGSPLSSAINPVHNFPSLSAYPVTLVVTNGSCTDSITKTINTIDQSPDITSAYDTLCRGKQITYTASNINVALTNNYFWDFGDGTQANTSTDTAKHIYANSGDYTVTLVTTDINGCKDTVVKSNWIRANGPIANFNGTNLSGCQGITADFNDLSLTDGTHAIVAWNWNFGDGSSQNSSTTTIQHLYNSVGTYSVQLTITDVSGCSDSITLTDLVTATDPKPDFISADTLSCPGAAVTFSNKSNASNYSSIWDFGDGGSSNQDSPSHIYAATGNYNVKLHILDSYGCPDSISKNLFITIDTPRAIFTINDSLSSCTPFEVKFTNNSTFYSSVEWDFGLGQGISTINNPSHYYTTSGSYVATLVATSPGGCKDTATKNISVFDASASGINYLPINGCKPLLVSLNTFSPGPIASYFWDFGDGYTETGTTPKLTIFMLPTDPSYLR